MAKVTPQDIQSFNERYYACRNFAQIARETGFSASTVRKYVQKDWTPPCTEQQITFSDEMFSPYLERFNGLQNFGDICELSSAEQVEIEELWKEMSI